MSRIDLMEYRYLLVNSFEDLACCWANFLEVRRYRWGLKMLLQHCYMAHLPFLGQPSVALFSPRNNCRHPVKPSVVFVANCPTALSPLPANLPVGSLRVLIFSESSDLHFKRSHYYYQFRLFSSAWKSLKSKGKS